MATTFAVMIERFGRDKAEVDSLVGPVSMLEESSSTMSAIITIDIRPRKKTSQEEVVKKISWHRRQA